jgi:hypothetical protein
MITGRAHHQQAGVRTYRWREVTMRGARVCFVLFGLSLAWGSGGADQTLHAESLELLDISNYGTSRPNSAGPTPSAGIVVMGSWDRFGYPNLIPGSASPALNQAGIWNAMASPGHFADYGLYGGVEDSPASIVPDRSQINPATAHPDDSMADFMMTARSSLNLASGATDAARVAPGIQNYATYRGYAFTATRQSPVWNTIINEIRFGRPVMVQSSGPMHAITGFRNDDGVDQIQVYSQTFGGGFTQNWMRFQDFTEQIVLVRAAGQVDNSFTKTSGAWTNAGDWSGGTPTASSNVFIPRTSQVTLSASAPSVAQGGMVVVGGALNVTGATSTLNARALRILGPSLQSAGQVNVASSMSVAGNEARFIGPQVVPVGNYAISGGELTIAEELVLRAAGRFEWTGGTLNVPMINLDGGIFALGVDKQIGGAGGLNVVGFPPVGGYDSIGSKLEIIRNATATQALETRTIHYVSVGGDAAGGHYVLPAGARLDTAFIDVGVTGPGRFHQQGGIVNAAGLPGYPLGGVVLGAKAGGDGTYLMDGGTLTTTRILAGDVSTGRFVHNAGDVNAGTIYVGKTGAGAGTFELNGGTLRATSLLIAPNSQFKQTDGTFTFNTSGQFSLSGMYELSGGYLKVTNQQFYVGYGGPGLFRQTGGTHDADAIGISYGGTSNPISRYELAGGTLNILYGLSVGYGHTAAGEFLQTGGTMNLDQYIIAPGTATQLAGSVTARQVFVGRNGVGTYSRLEIAGGSLQATELKIEASGRELIVSGPATLAIGTLTVGGPLDSGPAYLTVTDPAASITVSKELILGKNAIVNAPPGTIIHMTGSHFRNAGQNPAVSRGLANIALSFEGGAGVTDTFEIASRDLGADAAGLLDNFALDVLQLGGAAGVGNVRLVNDFDNTPDWPGQETLYVHRLILNPGAVLDLNGRTLYYESFSNHGGTIQLNGGSMQLVPEPRAAGVLACLCAALTAARTPRRRRER